MDFFISKGFNSCQKVEVVLNHALGWAVGYQGGKEVFIASRVLLEECEFCHQTGGIIGYFITVRQQLKQEKEEQTFCRAIWNRNYWMSSFGAKLYRSQYVDIDMGEESENVVLVFGGNK